MTTLALLAAGAALAVAAQFAPMTAGHEEAPAMPPQGPCVEAGHDSGCYYLLAQDEYPAMVYVQHEYRHCLTTRHGKIFEDGSVEGCDADSAARPIDAR